MITINLKEVQSNILSTLEKVKQDEDVIIPENEEPLDDIKDYM